MTDKQFSGAAAIVGLGFSEIGKVYGRTPGNFAIEATTPAVADAGLELSDVDGLITSYGLTQDFTNIPFSLGLRDLHLNVTMNAAGATASAAIQYASMAGSQRHGQLRGVCPR